jgi:tetratricopeptide (TPR) repeat protein
MHEDDALRALRAASDLRRAIDGLNEEFTAQRGLRVEFRIGVNSGLVVAGGGPAGGETLITGDAVNIAARLQQAASPGDVLVGEDTLRLARERVEVDAVKQVAAKGKSSSIPAYRLLRVRDVAEELVRDRPAFVGRERELERLREAFEDAGHERRCYLFTLLGSAGVGKSRLVSEFIESTSGRSVAVTGRCLPYGEGITFWPIGEIVRSLSGADDGAAEDARARVADAVGDETDGQYIAELVESAVGMADEPSRRDDVFWAIRRWLEGQARRRPMVCVVEDIHWAEATLLDLLEHIADWTRDAPILLLCTARPELLETRPNWGGGKVNATTVLLEPLSAESSRSLVETLVSQSGLPPDLAGRIVATAEGNPLFAEEITRMLADRRPDGAGDEAALPMPTSVQAVIAARLDRLPVDERVVAERASVAGRVFERGAVVALVPESEPSLVADRIRALMRKELVQPHRPELTAGEAFRFRHLLIRDAAYAALAKQERADLHERFAAWMEEVTGERSAEYAEIMAHHYEQAHGYRHELGLDDERSGRLARRAGELLLDAARRARSRGDEPAALKLFRRASGLLDGEDRAVALYGEINVLHELQRFADAREPTAQLERESLAAGLEGYVWRARLMAITAAAWSDPSFDLDEAERATTEAIATFERLRDDGGLGMAYKVRGDHHLARAHWAVALSDYERGIVHASRSDPLLEDRLRSRLRNSVLWGSTPSPRVVELFDEHAREQPALLTRVGYLSSRALAHAMAGANEEARDLLDRALDRWREVSGSENTDTFSAGFAAHVLGDVERADVLYGQSIEALERLDETGERSTLIAFRALVCFELGRSTDEVRALVDQARILTAADDATSQAAWRAALALVAARDGDHPEAERLTSEAAAIAGTTDFTYLRGVIARVAATIAELRGDPVLARERHVEALRHFEEKHDLPDAERARVAISRLEV